MRKFPAFWYRGEVSCLRASEMRRSSRSVRISCSEPNGRFSFSIICSTEGRWRGVEKHCLERLIKCEIISLSETDSVSIFDSNIFMAGEEDIKEAATRLGAFFPMERIA